MKITACFLEVILVTMISSTSFTYNEIENTLFPDLPRAKVAGVEPEVLTSLEEQDYCYPNEKSPHSYASVLAQKKGILMSVGTFRTLITFTLGEFDRLIMLDIAQPILNFNRSHLNDIKNIAGKYATSEKQRSHYVEKYSNYLKAFNKSGETYYWESDIKWSKIVDAIERNKIHVIHGNFARPDSLQRLIDVLKNLNTYITLDHSNVLQYVEADIFAYSSTIENFMKISPCVSVLATTQYYTVNPNYDDTYSIFAVGHEQTSMNGSRIDWVYYYFPDAKYYLGYIEPSFYNDSRRSPVLELMDWQINKLAEHLAGGLMNGPLESLIDNIELFLQARAENKLTWNLPLPLSEHANELVWIKLCEKICHESVFDKKTAQDKISEHQYNFRSETNAAIAAWSQRFVTLGQDIFDNAVKKMDLE